MALIHKSDKSLNQTKNLKGNMLTLLKESRDFIRDQHSKRLFN